MGLLSDIDTEEILVVQFGGRKRESEQDGRWMRERRGERGGEGKFDGVSSDEHARRWCVLAGEQRTLTDSPGLRRL